MAYLNSRDWHRFALEFCRLRQISRRVVFARAGVIVLLQELCLLRRAVQFDADQRLTHA